MLLEAVEVAPLGAERVSAEAPHLVDQPDLRARRERALRGCLQSLKVGERALGVRARHRPVTARNQDVEVELQRLDRRARAIPATCRRRS
jgi:hypothetical protein